MARFNERKATGSLLEALDKEENFGGMDRYNVTKLFSYYLSQEISKLPLARDVVVSVVNPGLCVSQLRRDLGGITGKLLDSVALSGEEGSRNLAWAATEDTSADPGCYISSTRIVDASPFARSEEGKKTQERFWSECKAVWQNVAPGQVKPALAS